MVSTPGPLEQGSSDLTTLPTPPKIDSINFTDLKLFFKDSKPISAVLLAGNQVEKKAGDSIHPFQFEIVCELVCFTVYLFMSPMYID